MIFFFLSAKCCNRELTYKSTKLTTVRIVLQNVFELYVLYMDLCRKISIIRSAENASLIPISYVVSVLGVNVVLVHRFYQQMQVD